MAHIRQDMAEAVFASVTKAIPYAGIQTWTKCSTADTNTRATKLRENTLAGDERPETDQAKSDILDAFIEKRTAEGGAPPES